MSFVDFARVHGVEIRELYPADRIQRCGTESHPRSKNGAYFYDGRRGWVQAWDGDCAVKWFDDPDAKPWTDEEKRAWAAKRRAQRDTRERRYGEAARSAAEMLKLASPAHHVYLENKGLPDEKGLVLPDGRLLVPMRNVQTNALQGVQAIQFLAETREWEKKFLTGMRAEDAVYRIGSSSAQETILCEGWATGLSIMLAVRQMRLNASVAVCFSSWNLGNVADSVRGRKFVFADNDPPDKLGRRAGEDAAKETGLPYCMAPVVGWDANDWHAKEGLMPVCAAIMQMRRQEYTVGEAA